MAGFGCNRDCMIVGLMGVCGADDALAADVAVVVVVVIDDDVRDVTAGMP